MQNLHTRHLKNYTRSHVPELAKLVVLRRIGRLLMIVVGGMAAAPMPMPVPAAVHDVVLRARRIVLLRSPTAAVAC